MNTIKFLTAKVGKRVGKYYYSIDDEVKIFYSVRKEKLLQIIKHNVDNHIFIACQELLQNNRSFVIDIAQQEIIILTVCNDVEFKQLTSNEARFNVKRVTREFNRSRNKGMVDYINSLY